jgi:spermidine synthase
MRAKKWQKWLSYLWEIPLERVSSPHNELLSVYLKNGRYQLCTANAIYSYDDLYDNFTSAFHRLQIERQNIEEVLLLGLGLGSIPYTLEKVFHQFYHYTAVEIDEAIIDLAHRYTLQYLDSGIDIISADAIAYVAQTGQTFDLICMDIFQDDEVPEDFEQLTFLRRLKDLLCPNGWLLYNRLSLTKEDERDTRIFFEETFRAVFPEATYLDVKTNWILLNRPIEDS